MGKNHMADVATILGIKLNERFKIKFIDGMTTFSYQLTDKGLVDETGAYYDDVLSDLLLGECIIIKQPWEPKRTEHYWTVYDSSNKSQIGVTEYVWTNCVFDRIRCRLGFVYRTRKEALADVERIKKFCDSKERINWEEEQ